MERTGDEGPGRLSEEFNASTPKGNGDAHPTDPLTWNSQHPPQDQQKLKPELHQDTRSVTTPIG
ncbi:hypothetical protein EYF80_068248 [Liparis tanakae]|uniref:Uncharacterized protein n=1 Tax=Liparis tanakae TaxID=230148 RepID=A0A4Z2DZG6_9TELE|nr:hypothetical protein EYF80_068248 [Liparis tanakae]